MNSFDRQERYVQEIAYERNSLRQENANLKAELASLRIDLSNLNQDFEAYHFNVGQEKDALREELAALKAELAALRQPVTNESIIQHLREIEPRLRVVDSQEVQELKDEIERLWTENQRLKVERNWIPVGERLPEHKEAVLIATDRGVMYGYWNIDRKRWYDKDGWTSFPKHWMPLPEPPKEGEL